MKKWATDLKRGLILCNRTQWFGGLLPLFWRSHRRQVLDIMRNLINYVDQKKIPSKKFLILSVSLLEYGLWSFLSFLALNFPETFLEYFKGENQNPRKSCDWKNELLACDCSESKNCDQAWISFFLKFFLSVYVCCIFIFFYKSIVVEISE